MQINSNRPADYYPLAPANGRSNARLPVVFDANADVKPVVADNRPDTTTVVLPATSSQDGQQARFVRNFSTTERQFSDGAAQSQVLPAAVQQYLFINEIPNQQSSAQGQFLDEMV
ncbi:hypothetical protein [Methylophaga sp.]|uniref:hypothetical protein n=1 Tax=Methylophaga sp. TaxID=2024840 RepID=UPI003F699F56